MEISPRAPKKIDRIANPGWQECLLDILSQKKLPDDSYELKIQLHTGRTHQIRAQLGFENCPILGDHAYGAAKTETLDKIELEASELEFTNPLTNENHVFRI
jgi:23S rRNA pseudouridine1911/1915/1917 synthase